MHIDLYLTPLPIEKSALEEKTVVVIDVLRATTTICAALQAKARGIVPMDGAGEAGELRLRLGTDVALLAGERDGRKIENFHLGNSPAEFTEETVGGKIIIMTTTNGTAVFVRAAAAGQVVAGALVNVTAVSKFVSEAGRDVIILCSGREGSFSIEDTLCGGMLIHLLSQGFKGVTYNDAGSLALLLYRSNKGAIRETIRQGEHGRFLSQIGFGGDIVIASEIDAIPIVPLLRDGRLTADPVS